MKLEESINRFYLHMTIAEVKQLNQQDHHKFSNVGYNTLLYLYLIWGFDSCTPSQLAEALSVTRPAVTVKINELIKLGLIEKKQSPVDRRVTLLELTPEVRTYLEGYDEPFMKSIAKAEKKFSTEQLASFCEILDFITEEVSGKKEAKEC